MAGEDTTDPGIPEIRHKSRTTEDAMKKGTVKIHFALIPSYSAKHRKQRVRKGYCRICGSKLSDEKSIEIGIGKNCRRKYAEIILEIPSEAQL